MSDRNLSLAELSQLFPAEYIPDKSYTLMNRDHPAVIHRNAAALLTAMLKRKQSVIRISGNIFFLFPVIDSEDAAFLTNEILHQSSLTFS